MAAYFRASDAEPGLPDDALRGFDLPCLFYVGSEDRERLAAGRAAADLVPGAQFHLIEGFDHSTTPAASEEVLGVVTPFLGRHSPM